jgi:hypothetical protein
MPCLGSFDLIESIMTSAMIVSGRALVPRIAAAPPSIGLHLGRILAVCACFRGRRRRRREAESAHDGSSTRDSIHQF